MKKLMVAIAAVATAFGLYADGQALNEAFVADNETSGQFTPAAPGWVAYTGDASKLIITEDNPKMLDISTGAAALKRNVANDGAAWVLGSGNNTNLYFDTTIDFKGQVLDDVPDVTGGKLAIFALDGTEVNGKGDLPAGTNVYVYAGYGTESKALYLLSGFGAAFPTEGVNRRIVVKTWANVFSTGTRSGFILYIQNGAAKTVLEDADIAQVQGVFTWDGAKWDAMEDISAAGSYLGGAATSVDGTYGKWVNQRSLFLNLDSGTATTEKFTTLDFQGNAKIASVNITDVAPVTFPADSFSMDVKNDITFAISPETVTLVNGKLVSPVNGQSVTITPAAKDILVVKVNSQEIENVGGTFTFTFTDGDTLYVHGADKKATVTINETDYPCESIKAAIDLVTEMGVAATITLNDNATDLDEALNFAGTEEITLDLNGKTISGSVEGGLINNSGLLKIIDLIGTGSVENLEEGFNAVENIGTLTIDGGWYKDAVLTASMLESTPALTITGGKFEKAINKMAGALTITGGLFKGYTDEADLKSKATIPAGYDVTTEGAYLKVQQHQAVAVALTIVNETEATITGVEAGTVLEGSNITFTVTAAEDYKNAAAVATGVTLDKSQAPTYSFTVGTDPIEITVTATKIEYATVALDPALANCTIVVTNNGQEVTLPVKYDVDDKVTIDVYRTPAAGYKLAAGCPAFEQITVTESTNLTAVVEADGPALPDPIQGGSDEQKQGYNTWATGKGAGVTGTDAELVDAFILDLTPAEIEAAGSIEKAASVKLGAEIDSDMLAALVAGGKVDFTELNKKYSYATFEFVEATELNPEEGVSNFWRLTAKFVSANKD